MQEAVWVPNERLSLARLSDGVEVVGNPQFRDFWTDEVKGAYVPNLMWRLAKSDRGEKCSGIRDDNRSALLTERRFLIGDREYILAVKGCGAEYDAFEHSKLTNASLRSICHDPETSAALDSCSDDPAGFITAERWFGNTPYGGQAPDNAMIGLLASLRANRNEIAGFYVCPIVAVVKLPEAYAKLASKFYWFRRYQGDIWQELRLMPSNVRLYFQSPLTFGADTANAFSLFGVNSVEACEKFIEKLARSSLAALTVYARTLRHDPKSGRFLGLGYHDVWLDKDAVIASDGTLHFADLEGVEDVPARDHDEVRELIKMQFYRNVFEVNFALEVAAVETERRFVIQQSRSERREWLLELIGRACRADSFLRLERSGDGVKMIVEPAVDEGSTVTEIELISGVNSHAVDSGA